MTDEPECVHEWGRLLSNPGRCVCTECRVPYDPDAHNPPVPGDEIGLAIDDAFPDGVVPAVGTRAA